MHPRALIRVLSRKTDELLNVRGSSVQILKLPFCVSGAKSRQPMDGVAGAERAQSIFHTTQAWLARLSSPYSSNPSVSRPFPRAWRSSASKCSRDALTPAWPQVSVGDMRVFLDSNWEPPLLPAEKDWILQRSLARCLLAVCAGRARSRIQIVQPGLRPSSRTHGCVRERE